MNINEKITLCIKTFERPSCLLKCIQSIRKLYPEIQINVADDSQESQDLSEFKNLLYLKMPFYSGCSAGRNLCLENTKTEYVVTLDDDFIFNGQTNLEKWFNILENNNIDLIGGNIENRQYQGLIKFQNNNLELINGNRGIINNYPLYDIVVQFWMAKTEKVKAFGGWDNDFKTQDHIPFFLNGYNKINISYEPSVSAHHVRKMPKNYAQYRHGNREKDFYKLILEKHNVNKLIEFGVETYGR